ncbi:MAG: chromosomal replication initiator protein DnaA [Chloroflexota bacterium]
MDAHDAWNVAYSQLELLFDRGTFDTWLRGATFLGFEDDRVFVIGVRNTYARDMLQHRLYRNIRRVLCDVCGEEVEVRFDIHQPGKRDSDDEMPLFRLLAQQEPVEVAANEHDETVASVRRPLHEAIRPQQQPELPECELNPRFRFERFIVNPANRITYEAARAVTENPGRSYNPLMIYGGVGLGKTHLLQAIAHACQDRGLRVIYIPSEVFTNDLVASIRSKTTAMFRDRYRSVDVLLVDDVQFIAGKDSTQEEFFHTFNALTTFNKQVVLASDRHPRELTLLEDRLRSRFEGGLVSDIQPLDYEARLALLEMWMYEREVRLERSVLTMIAERAQTNVRELEGVFNQIIVEAQLGRGSVTVQGAAYTLERFNQPRVHNRKRVSIDDVIDQTAAYFRLRADDLTGKRRTGRINQARQVAMFLARELTDLSLPQIGEVFGGRSHTTVLHGCNKIAEEIDFDSGVRQHVVKVRSALDCPE